MAHPHQEDSVQFALEGLMELEGERQQSEVEAQRKCIESAKQRREAEEIALREAEDQGRREVEARRLAEEQAQRELAERAARDAELERLRVVKEAEARVHAEEAERLALFELERQQIVAEQRRLPPWAVAVMAVLVIGGIGIGAFIYYQHETEVMTLQQQMLDQRQRTLDALQRTKANADKQLRDERHRGEIEARRAKEAADEAATLRLQQEAAERDTPSPPRRTIKRSTKSRPRDEQRDRPRRPPMPTVTDDPLGDLIL